MGHLEIIGTTGPKPCARCGGELYIGVGTTVHVIGSLSFHLGCVPPYPTPASYEAACKALWHWRAEAERLGKLAGETPRQMK